MDSEMVSEHVNRKHSWEGGGGGMPTDTLACCVINSHDFGHTTSKQLLDRQVCACEMIIVFINSKLPPNIYTDYRYPVF